MGWERGEAGRPAPSAPDSPPRLLSVTLPRGLSLGRPVGKQRHVTRPAAHCPASGRPPVAPAGRVPSRNARAPPRSSLAERGRAGVERKGKGKGAGEGGEAALESRDPGQPGKLRGGAWRRHFPAAACPSYPAPLQLTREGVG